jgi:hypothetical protein
MLGSLEERGSFISDRDSGDLRTHTLFFFAKANVHTTFGIVGRYPAITISVNEVLMCCRISIPVAEPTSCSFSIIFHKILRVRKRVIRAIYYILIAIENGGTMLTLRA